MPSASPRHPALPRQARLFVAADGRTVEGGRGTTIVGGEIAVDKALRGFYYHDPAPANQGLALNRLLDPATRLIDYTRISWLRISWSEATGALRPEWARISWSRAGQTRDEWVADERNCIDLERISWSRISWSSSFTK